MNAVIVLILSILGIAVGYGVYAKSIDRRIIQPDDSKATPATMYMDGVDFTPAGRNVLFGYQFKSVAALGPIVGPIVAVRWGWLPALLWVIFGTFFIGWVQDYASIMVGVREEGQTFGALSYRLVSPRARTILLIFIYAYLLLIMGAFGKIVGYDLMTNGAVPFGVLAAIGAGLLAGQMTYRMKQDIILTTVVTVLIAFAGIFLAKQTFMADIFAAINGTTDGAEPAIVFGDVTWPQFLWSLVTLLLCAFGAILPIWRWAQPINYVAFWIVFLGIIGGTLGIIIWHPSINTANFPAFTTWDGTLESAAGSLPAFGWLWPLLFVTIACGAISGWHSLVSSSGTARQLEKEGDALFVGGGAMFLEMFVATLSLLAAVVGVGAERYIQLVGAGSNAGVFANGLATFLSKIGLPTDYGLPYGMVFLTLMALTIMYLVVRFMRVASAEFLGGRVPVLRNTTVGTVVALVFSGILIWTGFWSHIWILFGGANQLMAALALLLISLWLMSKGKNYLWAFVPFVFMFITTMAALYDTGRKSFDRALNAEGLSATARFGSYLAGAIAVILIIAALVLAYDSLKAIQKYRAEMAAETG
jgi:carbon starvation protein